MRIALVVLLSGCATLPPSLTSTGGIEKFCVEYAAGDSRLYVGCIRHQFRRRIDELEAAVETRCR